MRCSNCSAPILDGTPVCSQCGANNTGELHDDRDLERGGTEPGRMPVPEPELDPADGATREIPRIDTPLPSKPNSLRSKLGAPRPAAFKPDESSTAIGAPAGMEPTDSGTTRPDTAETPMAAPSRSAPPKPTKREARARIGAGSTGERDEVPRSARRPVPRPTSSDDERTEPPPSKAKPGAVAPPARLSAKYAAVNEAREPEGTMAVPDLQAKLAAPEALVNPDELAGAVINAIKQMGFEDRLETFSAVAMLVMTFMPWRELRAEADIGLVTWAGFLSLVFASSVLGLIYLRITGRISTLDGKFLSTAEAGISAFQIPLTLLFIFANIDRTQQHFGSLTAYAAMPDFGAILSLVANFSLTAGAALVMQRERLSAEQRR